MSRTYWGTKGLFGQGMWILEFLVRLVSMYSYMWRKWFQNAKEVLFLFLKLPASHLFEICRGCIGGSDCSGSTEETEQCGSNTRCPVTAPIVRPGIWTSWSPWSPCSVQCGSGRQSRHRECIKVLEYFSCTYCKINFFAIFPGWMWWKWCW